MCLSLNVPEILEIDPSYHILYWKRGADGERYSDKSSSMLVSYLLDLCLSLTHCLAKM